MQHSIRSVCTIRYQAVVRWCISCPFVGKEREVNTTSMHNSFSKTPRGQSPDNVTRAMCAFRTKWYILSLVPDIGNQSRVNIHDGGWITLSLFDQGEWESGIQMVMFTNLSLYHVCKLSHFKYKYHPFSIAATSRYVLEQLLRTPRGVYSGSFKR